MTKKVLLNLTLLFFIVGSISAQPLLLIDDRQVLPDETFILEVKAIDFPALLGMQFSVNWDPAVVTFDSLMLEGTTDLPDYDLQQFNINNVNGGLLATSWTDQLLVGVPLPDTAILFAIKFKSAGTLGDSSLVSVTDNPVIQEFFYDDSGDIIFFSPTLVDGKVDIQMSTSLPDVPSGTDGFFEVSQNEPNPFDSSTTITLQVDQPIELLFEIHDANGKLVSTDRSIYPPGTHVKSVNAADLPSAGVYYYTLKTKDNFITNRMVLVR